MNEKSIGFELSHDEALTLDDMYLKNKSLINQMLVLKTLADCKEDHVLYYINTLVEELFVKPEQLTKYLKALIKQTDMPVNILLNFLKVMFEFRTKIEEYELFRKHCLAIFNKEGIDYEIILKDFI